MGEQIDYGEAARAGLSPLTLDRMWEPLRHAMSARLIPGASAAVLYKGIRMRYAGGLAIDTPDESEPATFHTMYDCASLTKIAVTLPLLLLLLDQGRVRLEDRVAAYAPGFSQPDKQSITLRQLLTHTSGFAATYDFYTRSWSLGEIVRFLGSEPLVYEPGTRRIYSDAGLILLGAIISDLFQVPLDQAAQMHLFEPLGMKDSRFCPSPDQRLRIAATEFSKETGAYWHGIVHDENARELGGVSGHAGLFSTADDLLTYARMWLDLTRIDSAPVTQSTLLTRATAMQAVTTQTPRLPEVNRGLGWMLKGDSADVSGALFSEQAFGHTGFTGTSLYVDPFQDLAVVLLTNRVHYGRDKNITQLRTEFHYAVAAAIQTSST